MKILIIEDDREIVEIISLVLRMHWAGAKLISTHLGQKGLEMIESEVPDIVILDLGLPDISGFEVLKQIRLFSTIPVIILTVRAEEADVVKGLEWGADEYVVKPFRQMEFLARVKAIVRRQSSLERESPLACGQLQFDPSTRQLLHGEKEISLTATEGKILYHLMKEAGRVLTYSTLIEEVWDIDYPGGDNNLKVCIGRLRGKLEADPSHPQLILTKPGVGYFLAKPG